MLIQIEEVYVLIDGGDQWNSVEKYGLNNLSLVLRLEYDEVSFIFTDDIEHEVETDIVNTSLNLDSTILKAAYQIKKGLSALYFNGAGDQT